MPLASKMLDEYLGLGNRILIGSVSHNRDWLRWIGSFFVGTELNCKIVRKLIEVMGKRGR